jgi:hypothetical protein
MVFLLNRHPQQRDVPSQAIVSSEELDSGKL